MMNDNFSPSELEKFGRFIDVLIDISAEIKKQMIN
jgi:hypothetical protein